MNSDFESDDDVEALFQDVLNRTMDVLKEQKVLIHHDITRQIMSDFMRHQVILRDINVPRILRDLLVVDLTQNTPRGDVQ